MKSKIVIVEKTERVSSGFLNIEKIQLRHSTPDGGMSGPIIREVMNRGNAAAVLVYDQKKDSVLLIEEFRIGNLAAGLEGEACWSLGPIAGMIDAGEDGVTCVIREAREEAGIDLDEKQVFGPLRHFSSPGGTSEMLDVFVALADLDTLDPSKMDNDADEHTLPVILSREELNRLVFSTASPASLITACFLLDRVLAGAVYA